MNREEELLENLIDKFNSEENCGSAQAFAMENDLGEYFSLLSSLKREFDGLEINEEAKLAGKARLMTMISMTAADQRAVARHTATYKERLLELVKGLKPAYTTAMVASMSVALAFVGVIGSSANSLPGSALYGVKTGVEDIQLNFASDPSGKAELHLVFAERRLEEVQALATKKEYENVAPTLNEFENNISTSVEISSSLPSAESEQISENAHSLIVQEERVVKKIIVDAPILVKAKLAILLKDARKNKEKLKSLASTIQDKKKQSTTGPGENEADSNQSTRDAADAGNIDPNEVEKAFSSAEPTGALPQIDSLALSSGVISPNNDGVKESLTITINGNSDQELFVDITSNSGAKVLTGGNAVAVDAHSYSFNWSGKDNDGNYAADGQYSILIRTATGGYSINEAKVTVDTDPPAKPHIQSPVNGSEVSGASIELAWQDGSYVDHYQIEASLVSDFSETLRSANDIRTSTFELSLPQYKDSTQIFWRVRGYDEAGNASSYSVGNFTIASLTSGSGSTDSISDN